MPSGNIRRCDHEDVQPNIRADVYREAIIDHMFIFANSSKISKLVFALKDQSLDYSKE